MIMLVGTLAGFVIHFFNKTPIDEKSELDQEIIKNLTSKISTFEKVIHELQKANADLVAKDDHATAKMERHSKMISAFKDKYENIETKVNVLEEHHENEDALVTTEVPNVQDVISGSSRMFITEHSCYVAIGLMLLTLIF